MNKSNNNIILYQDENGITKVSVRFSDEDLWMTEVQEILASSNRKKTPG